MCQIYVSIIFALVCSSIYYWRLTGAHNLYLPSLSLFAHGLQYNNKLHLKSNSKLYLKPQGRGSNNPDRSDDEFFDSEFDNLIEKKLQDKFPREEKDQGGSKPAKTTIFQGLTRWKHLNRAVLAGVFVSGIGAGSPTTFNARCKFGNG